MITVTENAVKQLRQMLASSPDAAHEGLRLFIEKGGCSGLSYGMKIAPAEATDARIEAAPDVRLFVEAESQPHLQGCTIDYHDGLVGTGFRIVNPNAVRTCGCGTSFEPAART